ncbi:MAG: hypothetical protein ACYS8W_05155 [Planctomycetota bacterium]|jgi:hypothetical protein
MKLSLPLKLAVFVIVLFAVVIAACLLWTPLKIRYYAAKLESDDPKEQVAGVNGLLKYRQKGKMAIRNTITDQMEAELIIKYWNDINASNVMIDIDNGIHQVYWRAPCSPFRAAVDLNFLYATKLFLFKGVDVNERTYVKGCDGSETKYIWKTPLDEATSEKMRYLLRSHGGKTRKELLEEEVERRLKLIRD